MKLFVSLSLLCCMLVGPVVSQENIEQTSSQKFSLDQAVGYALDNNRDVQNSRLDIAAAKKKVWETTAIGLPQANAKLDYTHIFDDAIELPFPDPMTGKNSEIAFNPTSNFVFTATQLVFSGEYIVGLKASNIFKELSQQSLQKTEQETVEAITNAYSTILVLMQNERILKDNILTMNQNINEMQQMLQAGFIEDTDVDQLKISRRNLENAFIQVSEQIHLGKMLLKITMGYPLEQDIELSQSIDQLMDILVAEEMKSLEFQVENNIDYRLVETQTQLKSMELRQQQVKYLPTVSAYYSYTEKILKPEFDLSPKNVLGLSVNIPLFTSGQRVFQIQQAKIEIDKMRNTQSALRDGLTMQFQQAQLTFNTAFSKYLNEKDNVELSKRIYDKTLIKYKEGLSTSLDLSQVQAQHLQAQSNYFAAILELVQAKSSLDKLMTNTEK